MVDTRIPNTPLHELVSPSLINLYVLRPMGMSGASFLPPCCPHPPRPKICGCLSGSPLAQRHRSPSPPHLLSRRPPLSHGSPDYPPANRSEGNVVASSPPPSVPWMDVSQGEPLTLTRPSQIPPRQEGSCERKDGNFMGRSLYCHPFNTDNTPPCIKESEYTGNSTQQ